MVDQITSNSIHHWYPLDLFLLSPDPSSPQTALLILNQPITQHNQSKLASLWLNSSQKFCVDGGAQRLFEWNPKYIPDYICGDLDSVNETTLKYYLQAGVKCVRLEDQDATDFTKTLRFALNDLQVNPKFNFSRVVCFCDSTGRLDHTLCNLHTLYDECLSQVHTYLIGSESITFLLRKGQNIIHTELKSCVTPPSSSLGKYCGFFPLGKPACVSTQGLKWNLDNDKLKFGTFVSSSNEFDFSKVDGQEKNRVLVNTDEHLLWTMSIN